jgi:hypothetical protein
VNAADVRAALERRGWTKVAVAADLIVGTSPHGVRHTFLVDEWCVLREMKETDVSVSVSGKLAAMRLRPWRAVPLVVGNVDKEMVPALDALMRNAEQDDLWSFNARER